MTYKTIVRRDKEIWAWARRYPNTRKKLYQGFHEIQKLKDFLVSDGYHFDEYIEDGGTTLILKYENGKQLAKARENCYSEGSALDLLEVYGLYGKKKNKMHGFVSAEKAYSMFLDSFDLYHSNLCKAV